MRLALLLLAAAIVIGVVLGYRAQAQTSLRAIYRHEVATQLALQPVDSVSAASNVLTESALQHLPAIVQRYVRLSGAVGQPHVHNVRARVRGRIRSGPDARWMAIEGEQHNFFDQPTRLFYLDARKFGAPVQVYHQYAGASATMRVTIASLFTLVDAAGPEMDVGETVTMFNDMCWIAAGALVSPQIVWEDVDSLSVRATFTNAGHTVRALLRFDSAGELVDFVSDDRFAASPDGKSFTRMRWSTPLRDYQTFGTRRLSARGEARWHATGGTYTYIELELVDVAYNVTELGQPL